MKSSQSNFNLRSPGSYLVRSYLITTVQDPISAHSEAFLLLIGFKNVGKFGVKSPCVRSSAQRKDFSLESSQGLEISQ